MLWTWNDFGYLTSAVHVLTCHIVIYVICWTQLRNNQRSILDVQTLHLPSVHQVPLSLRELGLRVGQHLARSQPKLVPALLDEACPLKG